MSVSAQGPSVSRPRIYLLDFIRLVAILLMIHGHTLDAFANPAAMDLDSFHWQTWVHLRGLTAPLFLMVSGAASVLGIRYEPDGRIARALLKRRFTMGLIVITVGYLMVFPANRIADLRWVSPDIWQGFLRVNILQLNGVTLLLLTPLLVFTRSVRRYAAWSLGVGFLVLALAPMAYAIDWFHWLPEGLAAYLSFQHGSLFPLFPASAYMFLGVGLGAVLLETPAERRVRVFRLTCLTASGALMLLSMAVERVPLNLLPAHDLYKVGHAYTLLRVGFALLIFALLAWVAEIQPRLAAAWAPLGRRSLFLYVSHLVLIYGTPWTPGLVDGCFHALSVGNSALFIPLVGGLSFGAVLAWDWVRNRSESHRTFAHASAVFILAYALVF